MCCSPRYWRTPTCVPFVREVHSELFPAHVRFLPSANSAPLNLPRPPQFSSDWMKTFHQLIPPMMANGTRAFIYAGDVGTCPPLFAWRGQLLPSVERGRKSV